jgi:long-chain acyl-CoA synthetase
MYSVEVPGSPQVPGEGKPRRSILCPDKLIQSYQSFTGNNTITTLYENFLEGVQRSGNLHGSLACRLGEASTRSHSKLASDIDSCT